MLKIVLAAVILIAFAFAGLAIRMLFDRKAEFRGGSCATTGSSEDKPYTCGCGGACNTDR